MSKPIVRVKLSSEKQGDFQPLLVEVGQPVLNRWNSTSKQLKGWVGELAAESQFQGEFVEFFARDEQGRQLANISCVPVTRSELQGPLKHDFAELKKRLQGANLASPSTQPLHHYLCQGLIDPQPDLDFVGWNCQFFKYQDVQGKWRLIWCYGYAPAPELRGRPTHICPSCRLLIVGASSAESVCPECTSPTLVEAPQQRPRRRKTALWAMLLLLLCGGGAGYWFFWPRAVLAGKVSSAFDGQPVAAAQIRIAGTDHTATTNESGEYRLEKLPRGSAELLVTAPGYQDSSHTIPLAANDNATQDVVLQGKFSATGTVVYLMGKKEVPIKAAHLRIAKKDQPEQLTNETGAFELAGLPKQAMTIKVSAEGFEDQQVEIEPPLKEDKLRIVLRGQGSIAGQVVYAVDESQPVDGAQISAEGFDDLETTTNAQGKFTLQGLPPEELKLRAGASGMQAAFENSQAGDESVSFRLTGDATLSGEVVRVDNGQPVANVEVSLAGTPFVCKSDEQGKFHLDAIPSGKREISAVGPELSGKLSHELLPHQLNEVRIILVGGSTVAGKVVDESTGEPIAGAEISIPYTTFKAESNPQGVFLLTGVTASPETTIRVTAQNFFPSEAKQGIEPGKNVLSEVALAPAATVQGRVVSIVENRPLAGARIQVGDSTEPIETDEEGRFTIAPIEVKPITFRVSAEAHVDQLETKELVAGVQELDDIVLNSAGTVSGKVVRAIDEQPIENAQVVFPATKQKLLTNPDGTFEQPMLPSGSVTLWVLAEGFLPQKILCNVPASTLDLPQVKLVGNATLQGVAVDASDEKQPVANVKLEIQGAGFQSEVVGDEQGAFRLAYLPEGEVTVNARAPGFQDATLRYRLGAKARPLQIPLNRLLTVRGVVLDARNKQKPIPEAGVQILFKDLPGVKTNDKGEFSIPHVAAGDVRLMVKAAEFSPHSMQAKVDAKNAELKIFLDPLLPLSGRLVDAENPKLPIAKAKVRVGEVLATTTADGRFQMKLPAGEVEFFITAEEYRDATVRQQFAPDTPEIEIRLAKGKEVSGIVVNAINNEPVPFARVVIAVGNDLQTTTSDTDGRFKVSGVPVGDAKVAISAEGFEPLALSYPKASKLPIRAVLSPDVPAGEIRIVLTWADRPRDLDGHLVGPLADGGRFHVSFKERSANGVKLDVDAKEGFGPETITLKVIPGTYRYYVAHSENLGTSEGQALGKSAAQIVNYYKGAKPNQSISIPAAAKGPVWHAFDIVVDGSRSIEIVPQNKWFQDVPSP